MNGPEVLRFAANLYRVPVEGGYFLVDAGLPWEARRLLSLLQEPPKLLFLTHHHLDHAGGARALWERFRVPILAHPQEWAYLTKRKPRPPLPLPLLGKALANWGPAIPEEALAPAEEGMEVFGFRVGRFACVTDVNYISEESFALLAGVELLVLPALRYRPHPTHFSLAESIAVAQRIGARRTLLTHIAHDIDHSRLLVELPPGIEIGYDGLVASLA